MTYCIPAVVHEELTWPACTEPEVEGASDFFNRFDTLSHTLAFAEQQPNFRSKDNFLEDPKSPPV